MITVSDLSSYLYCRRKLFLQNVLRLYEPPKAAMIIGAIRHDAFEGMTQEDRKVVSSITEPKAFEDIRQMFIAAYTPFLRQSIEKHRKKLESFALDGDEVFAQALPSLTAEAGFRARIVAGFMAKTNMAGEELWDCLTPKLKSEHALESSSLHLKGRIDRIEIFDDKLVPIELKTGSMPKEGIWPGHKVQIAAYMLLLSERGNTVPEGKVYYLDTGEVHTVKANIFLEEEVKGLIRKVHETVTGDTVPERAANEKKCAVCGLKDKCFNDSLIQGRIRLLQSS